MVFEAFTMVFVTGTLVWETKTVVSRPETILLAAGKMVSLIKKIFWLARTMVAVIGTTVCVKNTIFPTSETTVTAAQKMVSVAPTMVCKVLSIGVLIVEQRFANPKLVFFGAPARSHHY
jgi:membrane protein insertase Oxa1/YidC/SpoIIIJ